VSSALRVSHQHAFVLPLELPEAVALFTPEGERAWAEEWDPIYLAPHDGRTQEGMVFTTAAGGEATVWLMTRYAPAAGELEYVRATPGSRIAVVKVRCTAEGDARTRVSVTYTITGLCEAGNEYVRQMSAQRFADYIDSWPAAIERARSRA
jgi:hypothetical protein